MFHLLLTALVPEAFPSYSLLIDTSHKPVSNHLCYITKKQSVWEPDLYLHKRNVLIFFLFFLKKNYNKVWPKHVTHMILKVCGCCFSLVTHSLSYLSYLILVALLSSEKFKLVLKGQLDNREQLVRKEEPLSCDSTKYNTSRWTLEERMASINLLLVF